MQRTAPRSHINRRKRENRAAHHNRAERHQNHQNEQNPDGRAKQNPHGIVFSAKRRTVKSAVQNMVQNKQRKKSRPENSMRRKIAHNLMAHQKNKVRKHQNVGDDFHNFSYFHIQIILQNAPVLSGEFSNYILK